MVRAFLLLLWFSRLWSCSLLRPRRICVALQVTRRRALDGWSLAHLTSKELRRVMGSRRIFNGLGHVTPPSQRPKKLTLGARTITTWTLLSSRQALGKHWVSYHVQTKFGRSRLSGGSQMRHALGCHWDRSLCNRFTMPVLWTLRVSVRLTLATSQRLGVRSSARALPIVRATRGAQEEKSLTSTTTSVSLSRESVEGM